MTDISGAGNAARAAASVTERKLRAEIDRLRAAGIYIGMSDLIKELRSVHEFQGALASDKVISIAGKAADEIERLREALIEIERLGWKEGIGAEHAIASHYKIRGIARDALKQCA